MKYLLVLLLIVAACTSPPEELTAATVTETQSAGITGEPVPVSRMNFTFVGYGPGKSHPGTFTEYDAELLVEDDTVVGARGTINPASVTTGIERLDEHLKSEDFFHVEMYPEIRFEGVIANGMLSGPLTFHGVTKDISIPVNVTGNSIAADFRLDTTEFNMSYPAVDPEVRITFQIDR